MAMAGLTTSHLDACSVRCGVGNLKPVKEAVHNMFRGTVTRFCGVVPGGVLRVCFERAIATIDGLLCGISRRALLRYTSHLLCKSSPAGSRAGMCMHPQQTVSSMWHTATHACNDYDECSKLRVQESLQGQHPGALLVSIHPLVQCTLSARLWQ